MRAWVKARRLGGGRNEFICNAVGDSARKVLDIGCSFGWTLNALTGKADCLVGVDVNEPALEKARDSYPHIDFFHQSGATLPFEANEFDVVILSEVIEHVGDENKQPVIDEAHRVLKEGGLFLFTAPYAGLLAWTDPMDFKRRFPEVYKLYMHFSGYAPKTPIDVGHKHVSMKEIYHLFDGRFVFEDIRYCGLLTPFLSWVLAVDQRLDIFPPQLRRQIGLFRSWESGVAYPSFLAFNIRLKARKKPQSE